MTPLETLTLGSYFFILVILAVYGWHRYYLVYLYMKHKEDKPVPAGVYDPLPLVTVQLPLYNEVYVVDRLVQAVCRMDYPKELLEIQVLDDSTDETREIAELAVRRYAALGFDIHVPPPDEPSRATRPGRWKRGCRRRAGEFVAIFDADFMPVRGLPARTSSTISPIRAVGMVQARWGHLNEDYSLLTKIQAILLDAHFVLEHGARNRSGLFFNFNGTAGIWRREAIESAGGWQHDTLTEDLDLSYRAQLAGWRFVFLPDLVVAGGGAGRDERVQVAAAPLGQGLDPDVPQAAAPHPPVARRRCRSRSRRSST